YAEIFNRALSRIEAFTEEKALTGELSASAASNTLKYNFGWNEAKNDEKKDTLTVVCSHSNINNKCQGR
ncbi:MAG: hypothetical protein IIV04_04715, partial [Bacteroidaceae bacterium]|nr:hypothetical protein [Bacteroidaceae bacterium]